MNTDVSYCSQFSGEPFGVLRNRSFTLVKNERDFREKSDSVVVSESIAISMINCSFSGLPCLCSTFHQISTLEKTTYRPCSILSSLMSYRPIRVPPYLFASHFTSSEERSDFQISFSLDLQMQSRQILSDPLHGILMLHSSSASIWM